MSAKGTDKSKRILVVGTGVRAGLTFATHLARIAREERGLRDAEIMLISSYPYRLLKTCLPEAVVGGGEASVPLRPLLEHLREVRGLSSMLLVEGLREK